MKREEEMLGTCGSERIRRVGGKARGDHTKYDVIMRIHFSDVALCSRRVSFLTRTRRNSL
jgi:hypothetical protein